jgi:hypothetical protein
VTVNRIIPDPRVYVLGDMIVGHPVTIRQVQKELALWPHS